MLTWQMYNTYNVTFLGFQVSPNSFHNCNRGSFEKTIMIELLIAIFFAIYVVYHLFLKTPPNFPPGRKIMPLRTSWYKYCFFESKMILTLIGRIYSLIEIHDRSTFCPNPGQCSIFTENERSGGVCWWLDNWKVSVMLYLVMIFFLFYIL